MSHDEALTRARNLYKRQKYRLALEILESNTRSSFPDHWPTDRKYALLELRAALNDRQNRLNFARRDALDMLSLNPKDARGYLRLGKVCRALGKNDKALDVYKKGLAECSKSLQPQEYDLMSQGSQILAGIVAKASQVRCDPVSKLPWEILYIIFQASSIRELILYMQVSKQWRQWLISEPRLWQTIRIDSPYDNNHCVRAENVISYCKYAKMHDIKLDMTGVSTTQTDRLTAFLANTPAKIRELSLISNSSSAGLPMASNFRHQNSKFAYLTYLRINSHSVDKDTLWALTNLPELESLEVETKGSTQAPNITNLDEATKAKLSQKLKKISLVGRSNSRCLADALVEIIASIPSIESFDLHRVIPSMRPVLDDIISNNKNLRRFGFTAEGLSAKQSIAHAPRFGSTALESLTLNNICINISGQSQQLPLSYFELKNTRLHDCSIPEILSFFGSAKHLETLVVHQVTMTCPVFRMPQRYAGDMFSNLHTLQFTAMLPFDNVGLNWLIQVMPSLRKVNFDGTSITGSTLLRLLELGVKAVRCKGIERLSADATAWIHANKDINVTF